MMCSELQDLYYCMTGRAIQVNIQFVGGSIVPYNRREKMWLGQYIPYSPYCPTQRNAIIDYYQIW